MCDSTCRLDLAAAVCSLLASEFSAAPPLPPTVQVLGDFHTTWLLRSRRELLRRELSCVMPKEDVTSDGDDEMDVEERPLPSAPAARPPALQGKAVENGKSAMSFLVPGGDGVDPDDSATFSAIFKQVNSQEATLLGSLSPQLTAHYTRPGGSMLTPILGWLRYTPAPRGGSGGGGGSDGSDGSASGSSSTGGPLGGDHGGGSSSSSNEAKPFQVLMMDNVARTPPGRRRRLADGGGRANDASDAATAAPWEHARWKPFDMKGIKLYKHERRYVESFGAGGLRIGGRQYEALRAALRADVNFLTERRLVDFSYLLSVFPTGAEPRPCERAWRDADFHSQHERVRGGQLIPASYQISAAGGTSLPPSSKIRSSQIATPPAAGEDAHAVAQCVPVMIRLSIIDYLREWSMAERMEHVQKTIMRDLIARERNHAVVPVRQFADRFAAFFSEALFTPLPYPTAGHDGWRRAVHDASSDAWALITTASSQLQRMHHRLSGAPRTDGARSWWVRYLSLAGRFASKHVLGGEAQEPSSQHDEQELADAAQMAASAG